MKNWSLPVNLHDNGLYKQYQIAFSTAWLLVRLFGQPIRKMIGCSRALCCKAHYSDKRGNLTYQLLAGSNFYRECTAFAPGSYLGCRPHRGCQSGRSLKVSWVTSLPSTRMMNSSASPSRLDIKVIHSPSGENEGAALSPP